LNWELPEKLASFLGWSGTAIFISLGWIFFRANSLAQARQMLSAISSPAEYSSHYLSWSLYCLVACLAAGYAIVLLVGSALDRSPQSAMVALLARWRWVWIPSLYALALLFVFMVTHGQQASAGQLMYRRF
jgi:Trk-type K+ transport system membrane component